MIAIITAGVLLVVSIFFPWWGMRFWAPQYPEGLDIIVYPFKMEGEIDIINSLNHYIGMKPFSEADFPELNYLPYIIGIAAILTVVVGILRNMKVLYVWIGVLVIGGILGIYDIHRWLTAFGTELSPNAPIKLDPFVPPIIGKNTIANFVTDSYFTYGSFILAIAFLLLLFPIWRERKS